MWTNWNGNEGAPVVTVGGQSSSDNAKWSITGVGPVAIDPGRPYRLMPKHVSGKALDISGGSQNNGTAVQLWDAWGGDPQKLVMKDGGKGNIKLTMKANNNKCVGPQGGALASGKYLEIQDCNGSDSQAWITGETAAGSGTFMLKNVGAPGLCLDVSGFGTANGARMQIWSCTGANNQLFGVEPQ
jgi:hypothetical protein